ncbi:MAG TPA: hypothetical protein VM432_05875 [Bdellovibrionales bacterium]|nr:hypothetical protein [Bdellovibrionales bacterium]
MKLANTLVIAALVTGSSVAMATSAAVGVYNKPTTAAPNTSGAAAGARAAGRDARIQLKSNADTGLQLKAKPGQAAAKPAAKPAQNANDRLSTQASKENLQIAKSEGATADTVDTLEVIDKNIDSPAKNQIQGSPLEKLKAVSMEINSKAKSNTRKFGKAKMDTVVNEVLVNNKIEKETLKEACKI